MTKRPHRTMTQQSPGAVNLSPAARNGPKNAVWMAASLKHATGIEPVIIQIAPARWQLSLKNTRIRLTIDYAAKKPGAKAVQVDTALYEDGRPRPIAKSFDDFVRIFTEAEGQPVKAMLPPMPPSADVEDAPSTVRVAYNSLIAHAAQLADIVRLGFDGEAWVIGLELNAKDGLRLRFTWRNNEWGMARGDLQVIIGGADYTKQAAGDINKALAFLAEPMEAAEPGRGPIRASRPAQVTDSTSVRVRKQTVIRN